MKKLTAILYLFLLCGCDLVKIDDGEPRVNHQKGLIITKDHTWSYDYLLVKQYYKSLPDAPQSKYTEYHKILTNNEGLQIDLQQSIFILQKNGEYKKVNLNLLEGVNGIKLLLQNDKLKIVLSRFDINSTRLTDCEYAQDSNYYLIGDINSSRGIVEFNKTLYSPKFEKFRLTDGYYYQYSGQIITKPLRCN